MSKFDESYFPKGQQVQLLSDDDCNMHQRWHEIGKPPWLGYSHENKPYRLINIMDKLVIRNPYLERAFDLKQSQKGASIVTVYHGTIESNINSIAANNFNWRLAGRSRGVKHGRGVCFSESMSFAEQFCRGPDKCIIEARILYQMAGDGSLGDILPRDGCDTAMSPNGNVLVKFEDSDFIPFKVLMCRRYHGNNTFNILDFLDVLKSPYLFK